MKPLIVLTGIFAGASLAPLTAAEAPYINSWLVAGPFAGTAPTGTVTPKVGQSYSDGSTTKNWEYFDDRLWNRSYDNYQDLSGYYSVRKGIDTKNRYVYAHAYVHSSIARTAEFRFGASGVSRLIVNGAQVFGPTSVAEVQRNMFNPTISLVAGWNRILLEIKHSYTHDTNANGVYIAKDAHTSYLGFYGRISDSSGNEITGLTFSTVGDNTALTVDTQALSAGDVVPDPSAKGRGLPTNTLPNGYMEWPYVWNLSLTGNLARHIKASAYQFGASGGQPGYTWTISAGALPTGLTLNPNGTISGTCEAVGIFHFTVQVTDQLSATASKALSISVKDRPTRIFEEGRVGALSHSFPVYNFWVDPNFSIDQWAERAKRQGHSLVSVEALQQNYYWPSKFEDPAHVRNLYLPRDGSNKVLDGLKPAEEAVKRHGMLFGLYYATEGGGLAHFSTDVFVQNVADLIQRYDPAYLYFDGPQTMPNANYDVMYSGVRNYSDEIIVNSNVWSNHGEYGDADLGTSEASPIYSLANPAKYTKRVIVEPWKSVHTKNNYTPYYAKRDDFRQILKEMVMNVGRGYVDNIDQMPLIHRGPNWDSPTVISTKYPVAVQEFTDVREATAAWFVPGGKPERHESTTGTYPYFLSGFGYTDDGKGNIAKFATGKGPTWGYAVARDNHIYLHFIKGPDGKVGYQGEASVTISPVPDTVTGVTWFNEGSPLPFSQSGNNLTITLSGIVADPISTIIKIVTDKPTRKHVLTDVLLAGDRKSPQSLQVNVEGHMTYPALKTPFAPGDVLFASSNPGVATVSPDGLVTAVAPGTTTITATATYQGVTVPGTLELIVDSNNILRVDDTLIGAVLHVNGKETYGEFSAAASLPFTLTGRSESGGPIALDAATITMKSGKVNLSAGTQKVPVVITNENMFVFGANTMQPKEVSRKTRTAVWAEVNLDGQIVTSNRVFIDLVPRTHLIDGSTVITASSSQGSSTPGKVADGVMVAADGTTANSRWSATSNGASWIAFDLRQTKTVSEVEVHFNTLEQVFQNTPRSIEIQTSDNGTAWITRSTVTPPLHGVIAYFGFPEIYGIQPVSARYVRLLFPSGSSSSNPIDLLEVRINDTTTNNIAPSSTATASSEFNASYPAENVFNETSEWASAGEKNPWIQLDWTSIQTVNRIVLADRVNLVDYIPGGILTFSDGSSITVAGLDNSGTPLTIDFAEKKITWVRFQATGGTGSNNGLLLFEVHKVAADPMGAQSLHWKLDDPAISTASALSVGLDGSGDYFSASNVITATDNVALEFWVQRPYQASPSPYSVWNSGDSGVELLMNANGFLFSGPGMVQQGPFGTWHADIWHHIALVRKDGATTLYLDGVAQGTANMPLNGEFHLGRAMASGGGAFNGSLDRVRVFTFAAGTFETGMLGYPYGNPGTGSKTVTHQYDLGETDAGASDGSVAQPSITDSAGGINLTRYGDPVYQSDAAGSNRAVEESGTHDTMHNLPETALARTDVPSGMPGTSMGFDSAQNSYMVATNSPLPPSLAFGATLWVKHTSNAAQTLLSNRDLDAFQGWAIEVDNGVYKLLTGTGTAWSETVVPGASPSGNWQHLAVSFQPNGAIPYQGTARLFIDGALTAEQTAAMVPNTANPFTIGGNADHSGFFDGLLDDIQLYPYPLSASAVATLHGNPGQAHTPGGGPDISAPSTVHLGTLPDFGDSTATLAIYNLGMGILSPTASVVSGDTANFSILAQTGDIGQISFGDLYLRFNAHGLSGRYSAVIRLTSNDPDGPVVDVLVTVDTSTSLVIASEYRFGEDDPGAFNGGPVNNPSSERHGGTGLPIAGNPTYSASTAHQYSRLCVRLDGSGDYFDQPAGILPQNDNVGFELWVKRSSASAGVQMSVWNSGNSNIELLSHTDGLLYWHDPGTWVTATTARLINDTWHHLAVVRQNGMTTVYLDGVASGTLSTVSLAGPFYLGRPMAAGGGGFNGWMDDLKIFTFDPGTFSAPAIITGMPPGNYQLWSEVNFTPAELADPDISGATATPAGDGIANIVKYALRMPPFVAQILPALTMENVGGLSQIALDFNRDPTRRDINFYVQRSTNLAPGGWSVIARSMAGGTVEAVDPGVLIAETGTGPVSVHLNDPAIGKARAFYRWKTELRNP